MHCWQMHSAAQGKSGAAWACASAPQAAQVYVAVALQVLVLHSTACSTPPCLVVTSQICSLTPLQPLSAVQHSRTHAPLALHQVSHGLLPLVWQPPCNEGSEVIHRQQALHQAPRVGHQLHCVPQRLRPAGVEFLNLPLQSLQHQLYAAEKLSLSLASVVLPLQSSSMQVFEMHCSLGNALGRPTHDCKGCHARC